MLNQLINFLFLIILIYTFNFNNVYSEHDAISEYFPPRMMNSYTPELYVISNPPSTVISEPVDVYAKVFDKYGDLKNISLFYSVDNWKSSKVEKMKLIDGIPNNGTFIGTIPAQKENSTVEYYIKYEDTLNYSAISYTPNYNVANHILLHQLSERLPNIPVKVFAYMKDSYHDINNVTLSYYTNGNLNNISSIEMIQTSEGLFEAEIPPFKENTTINYYIKPNNSQIKDKYNISDKYTISPLDKRKKMNNPFDIIVKDLIINMENLTAEITVDYFGRINRTDINEESNLLRINASNVKDVNQDGNYIELTKEEDYRRYVIDLSAEDQVFKSLLNGDPLRYPFDNYHMNLTYIIPFKNPTPIYKSNINSLLNDSWIATSNLSLTNDANILKQFESDKVSNMNIKFDFYRNYSIAILVIPLFSIFFLLGAIFIFENSSDNIGNRLTLTLGIFALIFTLPEIIDSMKPQTSGPTIADSMLSIIIIATIAFTISSIISSSSHIQRWFPKHHSWIDGIVFVIVSGFVIAYFNKYLFNSQLWWLVPIILFGLGYGLLLRALGIKINKPLIRFSRVSKEKDV